MVGVPMVFAGLYYLIPEDDESEDDGMDPALVRR